VRAAPPCAPSAAREPLRRSEALERAAALLVAGADLAASLKQAGYRATRSNVVRITSNVSAEELVALFTDRNCALIADPALLDIGVRLETGAITALLAAPFAPQVGASQEQAAQQVLALVNKARATARSCGDKAFTPARALRYNAVLARAALAHSADMARFNYFSHDGRDGSNPAQRVERAGYRYRATGENIAAGMTSPAEAVADWIKSPPHCANLMNPVFTEMGVAYAVDQASDMGVYWAQEFGRPR
jgi:uncharacterized protein YkwD